MLLYNCANLVHCRKNTISHIYVLVIHLAFELNQFFCTHKTFFEKKKKEIINDLFARRNIEIVGIEFIDATAGYEIQYVLVSRFTMFTFSCGERIKVNLMNARAGFHV